MDITALRDSFFTVTNIFAERQYAINQSWFERTEPRPSEALLLFTNSSAIYRAKEKPPVYVPHGALIYIPRGYTYSIESHSVGTDDRIEIMLFEFNLLKTETVRGVQNKLELLPTTGEFLTVGSGEIEIMDLKPKLYSHYFQALIDAFESPHTPPISVYRCACAILECLIHNCSAAVGTQHTPEILDTALEYLGTAEQPEKSIREIAGICYMSVSGFEKAFRRLTGMTPTEYRLDCKIARVRQALCEDPSCALDTLAEICGFGDAAYLCRSFKKRVGMTPKAFAKAQAAQDDPT